MSVYSYSSLYKDRRYTVWDNLLNNSAYNDTNRRAMEGKKIVTLEVPEGAAGFTAYVENAREKITILPESGYDLVPIFNESFKKELDAMYYLYTFFNRVSFNIMGYLYSEGFKPGLTTNKIWIHDIYINDNWVDYPTLLKILKFEKVDFEPLPQVYCGNYDLNEIKKSIGSNSLVNDNFKIKKLMVKTYLEPYDATTTSVRNNVALAFDAGFANVPANEKPVSSTPISPAPVSSESSNTNYNKRNEQLMLPGYDDKNKENSVATENCGTIDSKQKEKTEQNFKEEAIELIKPLFYRYMDNQVFSEIYKKGIEIIPENKVLIYNFVKSKFTNIFLFNWANWNIKLKWKFIDSAISHITFLFCKSCLPHLFLTKTTDIN